MHRHSHRIPTLLLLLGALTLPAAVQAADPAPPNANDPSRFRQVQYEIRFMDLHAAEVLAWDQCPAAFKERCAVNSVATPEDKVRKGVLGVFADSPTHEKIARALAKADAAPRDQVFQAVLLTASNRPGAAPPDLTPGAQKALADLRGFLPYKSYEPVDAIFLRTTGSVEGHMVGKDGHKYRIDLGFRHSGDAESKELAIDHFMLREEASMAPAKEGAKPVIRNPQTLIATSFSIKQGETIVVGTSKTDDGTEALVLLLTAQP